MGRYLSRRNIPLYIAIICIVGIGLVFFFDVFYGVRETLLVVRSEGGIEEIDFAQPLSSILHIVHGENLLFRYAIVNDRFTSLSKRIEIDLYAFDGSKVRHFVSQNVDIGAWGADAILWSLETENLLPNRYTLEIKSNGVVRKLWMEVLVLG